MLFLGSAFKEDILDPWVKHANVASPSTCVSQLLWQWCIASEPDRATLTTRRSKNKRESAINLGKCRSQVKRLFTKRAPHTDCELLQSKHGTGKRRWKLLHEFGTRLRMRNGELDQKPEEAFKQRVEPSFHYQLPDELETLLWTFHVFMSHAI